MLSDNVSRGKLNQRESGPYGPRDENGVQPTIQDGVSTIAGIKLPSLVKKTISSYWEHSLCGRHPQAILHHSHTLLHDLPKTRLHPPYPTKSQGQGSLPQTCKSLVYLFGPCPPQRDRVSES